jgi:hypothetical protein
MMTPSPCASAAHFGQKTRPCPEPEIIALQTLMINQAQEVFGRFPASLIYVLIVSPSPAVPPTPMPLPSRSISAGPPAALDTALLLCSFLLPAAKETRSGCLCPDGCAPRGTTLRCVTASEHRCGFCRRGLWGPQRMEGRARSSFCQRQGPQ